MSRIGAFITGCAGPRLLPDERLFLRSANPWGLILFKRNCLEPAQVRALTRDFRETVRRNDAPVLIDQEGGRVQRLGPPSNSWRVYPPVRALGELYKTDPVAAFRSARAIGWLMAEELVDVGVTVNCIPVLDVPQSGAHDVIGLRAYSMEREQVMVLARAHAAGLAEGGVLPVIKHLPGHGRARADSHLELPVVEANLDELRRADFPPFAAFADAAMGMTAHVVYTALDGEAPATLSRKVIADVIRGEIGFSGLLMSDDLGMHALSGTLGERARGAIAAGCDVALYCKGELDDMIAVAEAAGPLKGAALGRARAALKRRRSPQAFDRQVALALLESLASAKF